MDFSRLRLCLRVGLCEGGRIDRRLGVALGCVILGVVGVRADVVLAPIFTDGAVVQRDQPLVIWGEASPGEAVAVNFKGRSGRAVAEATGQWQVSLPAMTKDATGAELVVKGRNTVTCRDVLVGDVWMCSGQSNMEFTVASARDGANEIEAANFPAIRQTKIGRVLAEKPQEGFKTSPWRTATPGNVGYFTAVGYFFAREEFRRTGVPIGLINCTWSGTPIEPWMSAEALAGDPAFAVVGERWGADLAAYPARRAAYESALRAWKNDEAGAKAQGETALAQWAKAHPAPKLPAASPEHPYPSNPAGIFNGMVYPLRRVGLRGVLWYQGEANHTRAPEYAGLFKAMITDWRAKWERGDWAFLFVQIARYEMPTDASRQQWAYLREAQTKALALAHTGMAVAVDIGETEDIHPKNKQEVGRRLAAVAAAQLDGAKGVCSGPVFGRAIDEGATVRMAFEHVDGGLRTRDGAAPATVVVAGEDHRFFPAEARIEGDELVAWSAQVPHPVAVRYAWSNDPKAANLVNGAGWPAVPFRSDDWADFPGAAGGR